LGAGLGADQLPAVAMSEIFDGYERQYCELSANLSRKCTSVPALHGGKRSCSSAVQLKLLEGEKGIWVVQSSCFGALLQV
jgi:hypothetical protein